MYSFNFWNMQGRHTTPNCKVSENFRSQDITQVLRKQNEIFVLSAVGTEYLFKLHASSPSPNIFVCLYYSRNISQLYSYTCGDRGSTVVKVPCYKSEGRWFDPSWCQWIFH